MLTWGTELSNRVDVDVLGLAADAFHPAGRLPLDPGKILPNFVTIWPAFPPLGIRFFGRFEDKKKRFFKNCITERAGF